jgi:hypothetical protein
MNSFAGNLKNSNVSKPTIKNSGTNYKLAGLSKTQTEVSQPKFLVSPKNFSKAKLPAADHPNNLRDSNSRALNWWSMRS